MVFEKIKFLAANVAPKPDEVSYWIDISANPYGGVIKYYDGYDWIKLDQDSIAEDYLKLRNKPTLNGVVIEGNKTSKDYNIPTPESVELVLNDFRNEINNIDEKVSNVSIKLDNYIETNEGNIEDIKQDIVNIQESLELILGESASEVIDKFNEILSFLEGYDDSQTLKGVISDLETKLTELINNVEDDLDLNVKELKSIINNHTSDKNNPHTVTKRQVGLDQVDNTSDLNKPISTLTQQALDYEANLRNEMDEEIMQRINDVHDELTQEITTHIQDKANPHQVTKEQVGLGNLTNDAQVKRSEMGVANGVATLNEQGLIPSNQLPSYVDDVIDCYATYDKADDGTLSNINLYSDSEHLNPIEGESGKIYVDITGVDGAYQFRWTGTQFAVVGAPTVIGEVTGTAFDGGRGKALEEKVEELSNKEWTAETVKFTTDLTITANVGVHTVGSSGSKTLSTTGKSVKQVMDLLFASEKNPTITQPYVNLSSSSMGSKEAGTRISPSYSASLNAGTYKYGPATGVTVTTWTITDTNSGSKDTASGTFDEFQVTDSTQYKITAVAEHTEGTIPVTNLGNEYPSGQIQAGSKTKQVGTITGHRKTFYGTVESKDTAIDSTLIRSLAGKSSGALSNGSTFNINIPIGAIRIIIAYPATLRDLTSVLDVNAFDTPIQSEFLKNKTSVQVEGANGYSAIEYKLFYMDYANANDTLNTYKVTI